MTSTESIARPSVGRSRLTVGVGRIAETVMQGVVRSGVIRNTGGADDNVATAVDVIRSEVKALIAGDAYADAREAVLAGTLHEGYVIGLVIANCVARIHEAGAARAAARPEDTAMFDLIPAAELRIDQPDFKAGAWKPARVRGAPWEMSQCFERIGGRWEGFVAIRKARPIERAATAAAVST